MIWLELGRIRKNPFQERILKQNVKFLKNRVRSILENEDIDNNKIYMVMVVPGRGYNIKIVLQDIRDISIRKKLKEKIPNYIYKGKYSVLLDNMNNPIF